MRWLWLLTFWACAPKPASSDAGVTLMTFNTANGAGDRYRAQRGLQTAIVANAELVALQEVDIGVARSADANTAVAISGQPDCTPSSLSADGVLQCGPVFFGVGFRGDDLYGVTDGGMALGINGDRRPTAMYGNALIARVPVASVVVVGLPGVAMPIDLELFASLANGPIEALAAHNLHIRSTSAIEPRSVLVARLQGRPLSVLALHLESGDEDSLRRLQLSAVLAVARGERARGRAVTLLGDFNMAISDTEPFFADAGYSLAAGEGIDQIWVDSSLTTSGARLVPTDGGSDHLWAPTVTVR